ncbi:MAG: hypothetical protein CVV42_03360 [Candidatus Riflebacteria bacterium HGW-Riflebacteria-2]|jgi:hypothetical protein|nr:MAG: hypothetical protein CVV42_03360 [Candidatus Riflebacteria bacterium HGW-Riflebacteria-2]
MRMKIWSLLLFYIVINSTCSAYTTDYKAMIEKYGPVPEAILEPPSEEMIAREKGSLLGNIFGHRGARFDARTKACYANQRITLGAIEMYNMDNTTMYTTLAYPDVADAGGLLVTGKYLRSPVYQPEPYCHLRSYGDLSDIAIIYCDYHGCLEEDRDGLRAASGYTPKHRVSKDSSDHTIVFVVIVLGVLSVGVMIVLHNVLPKAPGA